MSLSPKHTTPFSVTDILNPIEESYKKTTIEAAIPPLVPAPYRTGSQQYHQASAMNAIGSMGSMAGVPVSNPYSGYGVPQLSHTSYAVGSSPYCNGSSDLNPYDPMNRNSTPSWYGGNPDPRFASKYKYNIYLPV
eukprot:GHVR01184074.1.p1 GENE.GHVR01184074.1~~GHVR01184074.1.p1  ORF type:complete len:135 (+),score=2.98 GHVR01184074.1:222-626(+)